MPWQQHSHKIKPGQYQLKHVVSPNASAPVVPRQYYLAAGNIRDGHRSRDRVSKGHNREYTPGGLLQRLAATRSDSPHGTVDLGGVIPFACSTRWPGDVSTN